MKQGVRALPERRQRLQDVARPPATWAAPGGGAPLDPTGHPYVPDRRSGAASTSRRPPLSPPPVDPGVVADR